MNRYLKRLRRFGKSHSKRRSHGQMTNTEEELFDAGSKQDTVSSRAKSYRHGKSTADKWNQ